MAAWARARARGKEKAKGMTNSRNLLSAILALRAG